MRTRLRFVSVVIGLAVVATAGQGVPTAPRAFVLYR
jgi:hypothetical protein